MQLKHKKNFYKDIFEQMHLNRIRLLLELFANDIYFFNRIRTMKDYYILLLYFFETRTNKF
jgi:hypothetical protein